MKLYHGSDSKDIHKFKDMKKRDDLDFGNGVYFTTVFKHALDNTCKESDEGAVYEIDVDLSQLNELKLDSKSNEDLYYVLYLCRIGLEDVARDTIDGFDEADIIEGLVLDGNLSDAFEKYKEYAEMFNEGDIPIDELIDQTKLSRKKRKYQYCIKTDAALELINQSPKKVYYTHKVNSKIQYDEPIDM